MPTYPAVPIPGVDKLHGRHTAKFKATRIVKANAGASAVTTSRVFYAWSRVTREGSVEFKENTNPGSPLKEYQPFRAEAPTFEFEFMIPYDGTQQVEDLTFLKAGVVMEDLDITDNSDNSVFDSGYLEDFGNFIVERSTINFSRDDFTTVSATIRALGYTNANPIYSDEYRDAV